MKSLAAVLLLCILSLQAQAQTWCDASETVLLNGRVGILKNDQFTSRGLLSLCAKPANPPYSQLTYRYGSKKVEMSYSAPSDGYFFYETQNIMPRASVDALYFRVGEFTYAVTDCNGMHCGSRSVMLMVFKGKKAIAMMMADPDQFEKSVGFLDDITGPVLPSTGSQLNFDSQ